MGLGKSFAILKCQKKAQEFKLDIMFLMETRLVKDKGKQIWVKCGFGGGLFLHGCLDKVLR